MNAPGRVVEILGRKVAVRTTERDLVCHLAGKRVVVGDRVLVQMISGGDGKIIEVLPRETLLQRHGHQGRPQPLAANLGGLAIAIAAAKPEPYLALLDHYLAAAYLEGFAVVVVVTKGDLGPTDELVSNLRVRLPDSIPIVITAALVGKGLDDLNNTLRGGGPWALVGNSGVGKTTLLSYILPDINVGPIGDVSDRDGTGRHTTTRTRLFEADGFEIADSPGIRTFVPAIDDPIVLRDHYPGISDVACQYRDCLHRADEQGCNAEAETHPDLLVSYRESLAKLLLNRVHKRH